MHHPVADVSLFFDLRFSLLMIVESKMSIENL